MALGTISFPALCSTARAFKKSINLEWGDNKECRIAQESISTLKDVHDHISTILPFTVHNIKKAAPHPSHTLNNIALKVPSLLNHASKQS